MTEFSDVAVPYEHRKSGWRVMIVSLGLTAVAVNMIVGGVLGSSMSVGRWISIIIAGGIILAAVAGFTASYSHKTGKTFALQAEEVFGNIGSRLVAGFVGLIILGWYTIQASFLGHALWINFGVDTKYEPLFLILTPLVLASTAVAGFRALVHLSTVAVPAIIILSAFAVLRPASDNGSVTANQMQWTDGLTIVIALWIMGAVATIGDITRYARRRRTAIVSAVTAFIVGNTGLMLAGAWASTRYGVADLSNVLRDAGLPFLGLVLLVSNIWSTNDNAIYSVGLNWSHAIIRKYRPLVIGAAIFAALFSILRPYEIETLSKWLTSLGIIVPSLGGVIMGRRLGKGDGNSISIYLGLSSGVAISLWNPLGLAPIWGILVSIFVVLIADRLKLRL